MTIFNKIKTFISGGAPKEKDAAEAYDLWAFTYDDQPDNLTLAMENELFSELFNKADITGKIVADIGCGTGRHWPAIIKENPHRLIGYDVSAGMLEALHKKFPQAETYQPDGFRLPELSDQSVDILFSTLALAHMPELQHVLTEWDRVLKPGAAIIITDYHPEALLRGGNRTFTHNNKLIAIKNYIYPLTEIRACARWLQWQEKFFKERSIDDSVKHYYEKKDALHVFERFKGIPLVYAVYLKKADAAA